MKSKMNIKSIVIMAAVGIISLLFINMSLAANTGVINVETANLRETADEEAKILEQFSINQEVEIIEEVGEWYKVKINKITGYIRKDLITVNNKTEQENTAVQTVAQADTTASQTKQEENQKLGKQKILENTKLKIVPLINATDLIEVKKDQEVEVTEIINGWACIQVNTTKGWIRTEKLVNQEQSTKQIETQKQEQTVIKTLFVNSATVRLRKEASTSSEIIDNLSVNTAVDVLEELDGWSKVKVNGKEGYISSSLLSSKKQETSRSSTSRKATVKTNTTTTTTTEEPTITSQVPVSGNGSAVVAYAKQFIGIPYKKGGSSPSTGFDCSGFTSYVFKHFGVSLPRTSGGQGTVGTAVVSKSQLAPGDLVIYSGHVAIYVGGGQVIHSPKPGRSVCIVPLNQAASNYIGARRVI